MSNGEGYVNEILSLDDEIKRLNTQLKKLRTQRKNAQEHLYNYMNNRGLDKVGTIKIKSITPKSKIIRKKKKEKESEAIRLFRDIGIPDPQNFYQEFIKTQQSTREEL